MMGLSCARTRFKALASSFFLPFFISFPSLCLRRLAAMTLVSPKYVGFEGSDPTIAMEVSLVMLVVCHCALLSSLQP